MSDKRLKEKKEMNKKIQEMKSKKQGNPINSKR